MSITRRTSVELPFGRDQKRLTQIGQCSLLGSTVLVAITLPQ